MSLSVANASELCPLQTPQLRCNTYRATAAAHGESRGTDEKPRPSVHGRSAAARLSGALPGSPPDATMAPYEAAPLLRAAKPSYDTAASPERKPGIS